MSEGSGQLVLLVTGMPSSVITEQNQLRARTVVTSMQLAVDEVDGANPAQKDLRNELFGISGKRGEYPQFFIRYDSSYVFVGDWEKIEGLNDIAQLSEEQIASIKAADPSFQTLEELFAPCARLGGDAAEDAAEDAAAETTEEGKE